MNAKNYLVGMVLGTCALGLSVLASQKNPVERPFTACGHGTATITFDESGFPVSVVTSVIGQATHLGLYTASFVATFNADGVPVGHDVLKAANGDQLFALEVGGQGGEFTGGTGRFAGVTGTFTPRELIFGPPMPGPTPGTISQEFSFCNEGTITY